MISVLIVSYNGREHLKHGLSTLEPQQGPGVEVLVVDNASTDGSPEMVRESFPSVRLLALSENTGFGAANNRAAAVARGDRLLLLNSDAWLDGDALPRLSGAMDADPKIGLVAPQLLYPDGRMQFAWAPETSVLGEALQMQRNRFESRPWAHRLPPRWLQPLFGPRWFSAACILLRRTAFETIGGFDERIFMYFEDVDLSRRLRQAGWQWRYVPEAVAFHVKGGSRPTDRGEIEYRRAQLFYYCKHRPRWEQRVLRWKLKRKFMRCPDPDLRAHLLALLSTSSQDSSQRAPAGPSQPETDHRRQSA